MKKLIPLLVILLYLWGCGGGEERGPAVSTEGEPSGVTVEYTAPEPMVVPEYKMPQSDTDWEAKVNNKEIEVIQVLNIINPIAAFMTLHEEWKDTGEQLTKALNLYESCKKRKDEGKFNKKLFLDLEETWQILVKTGVAGVRTKSMLDAELKKL
jgi:hypothetical protein